MGGKPVHLSLCTVFYYLRTFVEFVVVQTVIRPWISLDWPEELFHYSTICQMNQSKRGWRVEELILHTGLVAKVILLKLFLVHSRGGSRNSQSGDAIIFLTWKFQAASDAFLSSKKTSARSVWYHFLHFLTLTLSPILKMSLRWGDGSRPCHYFIS